MYEWIIVGGGLHGCTIATYLMKNKITTINKIKVIDPHNEPMLGWKKRTSLIGMEFLRSPVVHHIDVDPYSLQKYARKTKNKERLYGQYKRPSLGLFNEHCDSVLDHIDISKAWANGKVISLEKTDNHWTVCTDQHEKLQGYNIVLTISVSDQLVVPDWAKDLKGNKTSRLFHIFDSDAETKISNLEPPVTIVGGGITAAHLTIKLAEKFPGKVSLLTRHDFRVHDFDSDPGWLGPKYLTNFHQITCYEQRRKLIQKARNKGSITGELFRKLKKLEVSQQIKIIRAEVDFATTSSDDEIILVTKGLERIRGENVVLATGFNPALPGGEWLKGLIKSQKLQCAACGYPIVSSSLEWCPHLFVSGPLAELEVGPIARNISGARHAAERIMKSVIYKS